MTNTLFGQSSICISKYKYSASLIISLLTVIVLTPTTMSYINITLFSILILCVSLFYLSRNNVIEGDQNIDTAGATIGVISADDDINEGDVTGLNPSVVNDIISGFDQVLQANSANISLVNEITQRLANQASLDSRTTTAGANGSSTSINGNGPYIDTTPRTKNDKVFNAYYMINPRSTETSLHESCSAFNNTQCDARDSCIWVNNICERGDKSGPYPIRVSDGSLVDVDYNYYKLK